jgi:hypothetical protein
VAEPLVTLPDGTPGWFWREEAITALPSSYRHGYLFVANCRPVRGPIVPPSVMAAKKARMGPILASPPSGTGRVSKITEGNGTGVDGLPGGIGPSMRVCDAIVIGSGTWWCWRQARRSAVPSGRPSSPRRDTEQSEPRTSRTVKADASHLDRMTAHYRRARARLDRLAAPGHGDGPLHPQFVAATVDRLAAQDAVFTADVGTPCIWAARYLRMNGSRRLIGSFNHGTMANALPHAIGAQPGRQVIALSGDGGLAMLLGELLTLRQRKLPVKVVVFNNGALSFVELEMMAAGVPHFGTDLDNPDFAGMARAAGLLGERVEKAGDLEAALRRAFAHDGPALVDIHTVRYELVLPPKLTYGQMKGFTLFATRTILSGEGSKLVELARANLREVEAE